MAIARVRFVSEGGDVEEREVSTSTFSVRVGDTYCSPAVTTSVEIENDGNQAIARDQCGNVQRQRQTNEGWAVRVQGIVTANDDRHGNLSLQKLRDIVANADTVEIVSDIESGRYTVSNTVITQANDLVSVQTSDTDGREQAFEFQLQMGDTESSS